jgi:hypothetical protein
MCFGAKAVEKVYVLGICLGHAPVLLCLLSARYCLDVRDERCLPGSRFGALCVHKYVLRGVFLVGSHIERMVIGCLKCVISTTSPIDV